MRQNILVIKLSALGDFIVAMGAMEAIRRHHPKAHITLLTTSPFKGMAQRSGYFDDIHIDSRPKAWKVWDWIKLAKFFNAGDFSRVYDLQFNDRTKLYSKLFTKRPAWSGVIKGSPLFYANPDWKEMHAWQRHKDVLKVAGIEITMPDLSWIESDISFIEPPKPYVMLIPGCAPQHPRKRWPAAKYGALATRLVRNGYHVCVIGTDAEAEAIAKIKAACPEVHDLGGKTSLYDIATLARGAAGVVGNDTGPTHLSAMAGAPVLVLFSDASNPARSAPIGKVGIVQADDLEDVCVNDVLSAFNELLESLAQRSA